MTPSAVDLAKLQCPDCGATYLDFRRTGRLGCPYDYLVFRVGLAPLLDRVHRGRRHSGKRPRRPCRSPEVDRQIRALRRMLRTAVDSEDYAQAALLRDQIRGKERENGTQ
jgi:protein arginine kinase activator